MEIPFKATPSEFDTTVLSKSTMFVWLKTFIGKLHKGDSLVLALPSHSFFNSQKLIPIVTFSKNEWIYIYLSFHGSTLIEPIQEKENSEDATQTTDSPVTPEKSQAEKKPAVTKLLKAETHSVKVKSSDMPAANADEFEKEAFTLRYYLEYTRPELLKYEIEPGIYIHITNKGIGATPKFGDIVSISYVGRFAMNGKKFDDSSFNPQPFEFIIGKPDQLLKGIEKALYKMKEGGRAEVIFTSKFGYGANGSSTGIVGKYKSLSFAVHLKKIRSNK